ncbi:MAG: hypothetical protein GQF41_3385 [Candidatus Rifleibacterium amylolyticum]|nr:MAG: hypothetical protein GQF41_3385 [Candidatus Rifleibacterium amylolyticum]
MAEASGLTKFNALLYRLQPVPERSRLFLIATRSLEWLIKSLLPVLLSDQTL